MLAEAYESARMILRAAMLDFVEHLMIECRPSKDGEGRRRFSNTWIEKVESFEASFEARNITNDAELKALVAKAAKITKGIDATDLRDNESLRAKVRAEFDKLKADIAAGMTSTSGQRAIVLTDGVV